MESGMVGTLGSELFDIHYASLHNISKGDAKRVVREVSTVRCWMIRATNCVGAIPVWLHGPKNLIFIA